MGPIVSAKTIARFSQWCKEREELRAKSSEPCPMVGFDGKHHWEHHRATLGDGFYKHCQCGAWDKS